MNNSIKSKFNFLRVGLLLAMLIGVSTNMQAADSQSHMHSEIENGIVPEQQELSYSQINEMTLPLLEKIDVIFDTVGMAYANSAIGKGLAASSKANIGAMLMQVRTLLAALQTEAAVYKNRENTLALVQQTVGLTDLITVIIHQGITALVSGKTTPPKVRTITITQENADTLTEKDLAELITLLDKELHALAHESESLGLTKTNKAFRATRAFWNKWHMGTVLKKTVFYGGFALWAATILPAGPVNFLTKPLPNVIKDFIEKTRLTIGNSSLQSDDTKLNAALNVDNNAIAPNDISQTEKSEPKTNKNAGTLTPELAGQTTILNYPLSSIFKIGVTSTLGLEVGHYFSDIIKSDYQTVVNYMKKLAGVAEDHLFGAVNKRSMSEEVKGEGVTFKDIIGRDEIKAELEKVIDYVCNANKYDRAKITPEKGFLFVGPSQNGKSAMVNAFANELKQRLTKAGKADQLSLMRVSVEQILTPRSVHYAMLGATGITDNNPIGLSYFVNRAESAGHPVILFIDEVDMLNLQRDRDTKVLADMLTAMSSGLSSSEKNMVIIIAATNKPTNIDFALRQHGRFGKTLWFDKPTYKDRVEFFERAIKKRFMDPSKFSCKKLAHETEGSSFGTLLAVERRAFFDAKQAGVAVTQDHFEHAINTEVKNITYTAQELPAEKVDIIATHQAGKALVSMLLNPKRKLARVTILPCARELEEEHINQRYIDKSNGVKKQEQRIIVYGSVFSYSHEDELDMPLQDDLIKECKIVLAGNIAQKVMNIKNKSFDKTDKETALKLARKIASEGFDEVLDHLPKEGREKILTTIQELLQSYEAEVTQLLTTHKDQLAGLITALKERKELDRTEVTEILNEVANPSEATGS